MNDVFLEGVNPGGLTSKTEIKILICYLLSNFSEPLPKSFIAESMQRDGLANYFECQNALSELLKGELISADNEGGEECYTITETGVVLANTLERDVPYSVREKALRCVMQLLAREKRDRENKVEIAETPSGVKVSLRMLDQPDDLLSLSLTVADKPQAELIKARFLDNPNEFYRFLIAYLTGDKAVAKTILELKDE